MTTPHSAWDLSSPNRDQTPTSCIGRQSLNHWITREVSHFHILNNRLFNVLCKDKESPWISFLPSKGLLLILWLSVKTVGNRKMNCTFSFSFAKKIRAPSFVLFLWWKVAFGVCYWAIIGALNSFLCGQLCCCCSIARLCLTLCNPMDCREPDFLVLHYLPEFAQAHVYWVGDTIQCLILCGQCNLFITWGKVQELSERSSCYGERILKMGLGKYCYHHVTFFFEVNGLNESLPKISYFYT